MRCRDVKAAVIWFVLPKAREMSGVMLLATKTGRARMAWQTEQKGRHPNCSLQRHIVSHLVDSLALETQSIFG